MSNNLLTKISFATVIGKPEMSLVEVENNGKKEKVLRGLEKMYMRVAGVVKDSEVKTTPYGDSIEFKGEFRAVDMTTGEQFDAGKMFLPEIAETYLANALNSVKGVEGFSGLEIAFDVGVKPANTPHGYQYTVKPLVEQKKEDNLSRLLGSLPALELPKPEEKKK